MKKSLIKEYLAIIPARGGSKRLSGKNVLPLSGKPLIAWTIEAAKKSSCISEIVVSTDDEATMMIAQNYNVSVPFIRPASLASDFSSSVEVIEHAIEFYRDQLNQTFVNFILLQPTSPLRITMDIDDSINLMNSRDADNIISVSVADVNPMWCNKLPDDQSMNGFVADSVIGKSSQELGIFYKINGAIFICRTDRFLREKKLIFNSRSYAYIMPRNRSIDIDDELDFYFAECLMKGR